MKKEIRHIGALTTLFSVGTVVFIASYLNFPPLFTSIVAAASTVTYPLYQRINRMIDEHRERKERKKTLETFTEEVRESFDNLKIYPENSFSLEDIEERLEKEKLSLNRSNFYEKAVEVGMTDMERSRKKIVLALIAAEILERKKLSRNSESKLRKLMENIISSYDIRSPTSEERELVSGFDYLESEKKDNFSNIDYIFVHGEFEDEEITRELLKISEKYGKGSHVAMSILEDKEKVEEFHRTLSKLIKRGKLRLEGVEQDLEALKQDSSTGNSYYLIFVQKLQYSEKFENKLSQYPHINFGTLDPKNNFPNQYQYLSTFMISSPVNYESPQEFLENELNTVFSDVEQEDKFIAVLSLETEDIVTKGNPSYREEINDALGYLEGESDSLTYDMINQEIRKEVEISELLSSIPFNILVPGIKEDEKDVIINNYGELKASFAIEDLFDWASRNPEEIAEKIVELDENETSSKSRWIEIAGKITEEAKKCDKATLNSLVEN